MERMTRLGWCTALGLLAGGAGPAAPASAAPDRPPAYDLTVKRVDSPDYVVHPDAVEIRVTIKNVGRKKVDQAKVKIKVFKLAGPGLPFLTPAFSESIRIDDLEPGEREDTRRTTFDPEIGLYAIEACTKLKRDGVRSNNCKDGKDLSVIPFAWGGTSTWTVNFGSLNNDAYRETADTAPGADALFTFTGLNQQGVFEYTGSGRVTYGVSGTDLAGCTHSGSATFAIQDSTLTLAKALDTYRVSGPRPLTQTYQATQTCPMGGGGPYPAPVLTPFWLSTGVKQKPTDATTLSGTNLDPSFGGTWNWSLTAQG